MTIQVNIFANEFERVGTFKDAFMGMNYDSLKIIRFGNGRVYFMAMNSQINGKVGCFAKQMQFVDGQVIISFGKKDKMVIGTYIDTDVTEETASNEQTEDTTETIEETPVNEVKEETTITETAAKEIKSLKVSKEKENIIVRGYMGRVEERKGNKIKHPEFEIYLVRFGDYWAVFEKLTGKSLVRWKKTKRETMQILEETLNLYSDKLREFITATIERDGYIKDYEIGSWIRSA
jgi:hypothetical protein